MALKALFEKGTELPPEIADHYAEDEEGNFVLQVERVNGWALEDVEGLKSALGKERKQAEDLRKKYAEFDGFDPKKVKKAFADLEKFQAIDPEKQSDLLAEEKFKSAKDQLVSKHEEALNERDAKIGGLTAALDTVARKNAATAALAAAKGNVKVLLPHVLDRLKLDYRDGQVEVAVIDSHGNPRIHDAKGTPMTVEQLVEDMRSDRNFASCFEGTGNSGAGMGETSGGSSGGSRGGTRVSIDAPKNDQNAAIARRLGAR